MCEGAFWRRTDRQEVRRVVLAARRYELAGRQKGRRRGPLGHVGLEVIELLANLVSYRSGRLEPSYAYLMAKLRRSKDAVHRALTALREHGFLDWLRRHEAIELVEGPGPQSGRSATPTGSACPRGQHSSWATSCPRTLPDDVVAGTRGARCLPRRAQGHPALGRAAASGGRG
jgi:hypothetical protein